jgi:galactokinase
MAIPRSRNASVATSLRERFRKLYGTSPRIFIAPGRVNLIGEHTDYNDGFVMPAAIDSYTWIAAAKRADEVLNVFSEYFGESVQLRLNVLAGPPGKHWSDYVRGVAAVLQSAGHKLSGAHMLIRSNVPLGAGLSSSASLEVSTAWALTALSGIDLPLLDSAKLCQRAEHQYAGTRCGIMDQFIAVFGRAQCALMLDCRSLEHQVLTVPADVSIVICNSMVKHEHSGGEYNSRRTDCENGVKVLQRFIPNVRALRDVNLADLEQYREELPERVYRRCRHVISENQRVLAAAEALRTNDLAALGKLMYESHVSMRDDYEISCPEIDFLVEMAADANGVSGSRMTGGGFGGCTVNLVRSDVVEDFRFRISEGYRRKIGINSEIYVCSAAQGAREWQPNAAL